MKSVSSFNFAQVPRVEIPRSVFNRSHGHKTTFNEGYLVPFYVDEALPGDTFQARTSIFARLGTPLFPIMDNMYLETFYFAVPYRLVWNNFNKFMGEQTNPGDSVDYLVPQVDLSASRSAETLFDYLGIPPAPTSVKVSALASRSYNLIYNEWFRDQNLINSAVVDRDDGPDSPADYVLRRRGKRHDYFTSCLPWPQKGTAVTIGLAEDMPVYGNGMSLGLHNAQNFGLFSDGSGAVQAATQAYNVAHNTYIASHTAPDYDKTFGVVQSGESGLHVDLSDATSITINALREAFQVQRMLERNARSGSRYTEIIRAHFGVISPDARLQRPEYLGGSSCRIVINPVQQTSAGTVTGATPQGHLAAYGLANDQSGGFTKSFTEHTLVMGIVCVRTDLSYQQGAHRMYWRRNKLDFYWPALAHLGEQPVYVKEIYTQSGDGGGGETDGDIFGYQERYAEYRYCPNQISGKFRSTYATPLDAWHLAQEFESQPLLNQTFIEQNATSVMNRVLAVPSEPHIIFDSYMDLKCARPMPVYSVPGLIDHF